MPAGTHGGGRPAAWLLLLLGIAFCLSVRYLMGLIRGDQTALFWIVSLSILAVTAPVLSVACRSTTLGMELASTLPVVWLVYRALGYTDPVLLHLPLVTAVLVSLARNVGSRPAVVLAGASLAGWVAKAVTGRVESIGVGGWLLVLAAGATLVVNVSITLAARSEKPRRVNVILCSFTGNTAHMTELLADEARRRGVKVTMHRFHHYRGFSPSLDGDMLVIAFPVIGWKPPWPLLSYLLFRLPRGRGRPALIMCTASGAPENTGLLCWSVLSARGYRVVGWTWSAYPLNVPGLRLGPERVWRRIDLAMPRPTDVDAQARVGRDLAGGLASGLPVLVSPTPLPVLGIALDNRLFNRFAYRNFIMRDRCHGCGLCIGYCPASRLLMVNGHPLAEGECALCFGCVNLCPQQAMQVRFLSSYGNPYRPRWREHVVMGRGNLGAKGSRGSGTEGA